MNGFLDLQKAVYAALSGNAPLTAIIGSGRVFDSIPDRQAFPYVQIGDAQLLPFDSHNQDGVEGTFTVHSWSRNTVGGARGRAECQSMMGAVYEAFQDINLSVTGYRVIVLKFDFSDVLVDPDGLTYHGVTRFKIMMGEL